MNKPKLLALAERFEQKKELVDMGCWFNSCGTAGCIAGEACLSDGAKPAARVDAIVTLDGDQVRVADAAQKLLDLSEVKAELLFYFCYWPEQYRVRYHPGGVPGSVVAARIRHFVATEGRE